MKASIEAEPRALPSALRWGIAGCGEVAARRVGPAIAAQGPGRLAGIYGRRLATARAFAENLGATFGTDDFDALCDRVDAIYVATPVATHLQLATRAMERGLPVLIEKPLCVGLGDLAAFVRAGTDARAPIGVAYYRRLAPAFQWLTRQVARGRFGHFRHAKVAFAVPFDPPVSHPKAWRLDRTLAGGGVLADVGSHRLDLLCALFGFPAAIAARMEGFTAGDCERAARVALDWPSGAQAQLDLSWAKGRCDSLALTFDLAEIVLDPLDSGRIVRRCGRRTTTIACDAHANPHAPLIADFEAVLRRGGVPACSMASGLTVDALIVAARASSDTGRAIALADEADVDGLATFIMRLRAPPLRTAACGR